MIHRCTTSAVGGLAVAVLVGAVVAGCGGDDTSSDTLVPETMSVDDDTDEAVTEVDRLSAQDRTWGVHEPADLRR